MTFPILAHFQRLIKYHNSHKKLQRYQIVVIKSNGIITLPFAGNDTFDIN